MNGLFRVGYAGTKFVWKKVELKRSRIHGRVVQMLDKAYASRIRASIDISLRSS